MVFWNVIGRYLDRNVRHANIPELSKYICDNSIASSVLAIYFHSSSYKKDELREFYRILLSDAPLAIFLIGWNVDEAFDILLQIQGSKNRPIHSMTYTSVVTDWKDNLFWSAWPATDRFNDWQSYSILEIGGNVLSEEIISYLSE